MSIDWSAFTPWSALAGGMLIGLAASLLLVLHGRIAGISGIVGGLLQTPDGDHRWRIAFLGGLIAAPLLWALSVGTPSIQVDAGYPTLILAGLLVGFFTRLGAGCTSGHGVCGLSRLSPRSLVATLSFMAAGFATVFVMRHLFGG